MHRSPVSYKTRTSPAGASFRRHLSMACSVGTSLCSISAYNCKLKKMPHISFLSYRVARIRQMQTTLSWMENTKNKMHAFTCFAKGYIEYPITKMADQTHKGVWSDTQRWLTRYTNDWPDRRWLAGHTKKTVLAHKDDWANTQWWLTRHPKMTA